MRRLFRVLDADGDGLLTKAEWRKYLEAVGIPKKRKTTKKEAATPAEASKAEIAKIEAELTKILKDEANDSMTYAGTMVVLCGEG